MRHAALGWGTLLIGVALLLPSEALAQKKKKPIDKEKSAPAEKKDYETLIKLKEAKVKVVDLDDAAKVVTVRLEYQHYQLKKGAESKMNLSQSEKNDYHHIMTYKHWTPAHRAQRLQEFYTHLQKKYANLFDVKTDRKDFDLDAIDKIVVRWKELPTEYDEKGNVKEYTPKELKERRGKDSKVPGYSAEWADLRVGQEVQVYVTTPKKKAKTTTKEPAKDKKDEPVKDKKDEPAKDKKDDSAKIDNKVGKKGGSDTPNEPNLAAVRMIVILSDAATPPDKKGKKKNP